jgi:hypothetical protein
MMTLYALYNPLSSWHYGSWSPHISPYLLKVFGPFWTKLLFSFSGSILKTHFLKSFQLQEGQQSPSIRAAEHVICCLSLCIKGRRYTHHSSRSEGRRYIPPMLGICWSCGNSKLGSGRQQHSIKLILVQSCMARILVSYVISARFIRDLVGNFMNISLLILCFLTSRQIEDCEWCPRKKMMMILYGWIQCLVGTVDCYFRSRVIS